MMNFQAKKMPPTKLKKSLWLAKRPDIMLDGAEIEALFKKKVIKKGSKKKPKKPEKISLIDPKRSNNCGIAMSRIKIPMETLMSVLLECNPSGFDPDPEKCMDYVDLLEQVSPQDDEVAAIQNFKGDQALLADVEQFFLKLMNVKGSLADRVQCMKQIMSFDIDAGSVAGHLAEKNLAAKTIVKSQEPDGALMYFACMVLEVGNFMNHGGRLKDAKGYPFADLLKSTETKSPYKRGFTLMAYIVQFTRDEDEDRVEAGKIPHVPTLVEEMKIVGEAVAFPYDILAGDVANVAKGLKAVTKAAASAPTDDPNDRWAENAAKFVTDKTDDAAKIATLFEDMNTNIGLALQGFAEPPDAKAGDGLFGKMQLLGKEYEKCLNAMIDDEEKTKKEWEKVLKKHASDKKKKERKAAKKAAAEEKKRIAAEKKAAKEAKGKK